LRRIFQDIPASMKTDVMTEVMGNPKLLATLLKKAKTEPEKLKLSKRLGQLFTEAGFFVTGGRQTIIRGAPSAIRAIETEEYDPTQDETIGDQSSVEPSIQMGTPTTQVASSQPFLSGLNAAPAGGGISSTASAPTNRAQYASLFPNDIVSGMIPTATMADGGAVPPRNVEIKGQPHMLAYITPQEGGILQLLGGSGKAGPMGIPSYAYGDPDAESDTSTQPGSGGGDMGLDSSIADMANAMAGHTAGTTGYSDVQGSINYAPVQNVPYDFLNMKDKMNKHARDSLSKGYSPEFSVDKNGNITSVTGKGGASGMPGIGGLISMMGANMGAVTTTGYAGKGVDDMNDPNDNGNDNELIRRIQPITPQEEYRKAITIYNQNPNRYTLRTR